MRLSGAVTFGCVALVCGLAGAQTSTPSPRSQGSKSGGAAAKSLSLTGCVCPGVEEHCWFLTAADGTKYDLKSTVSWKAQRVYRVTGSESGGFGTCQQGKPFQVTHATLLKTRCPLPCPKGAESPK